MRHVFYKSAFPLLTDWIIVSKISNTDGTTTFAIVGTDEILSFQPDRTWQTRPMNTIGPWEKAIIEGNVATFNSAEVYGHFAIFPIPN